jgi:hypothetical protein
LTKKSGIQECLDCLSVCRVFFRLRGIQKKRCSASRRPEVPLSQLWGDSTKLSGPAALVWSSPDGPEHPPVPPSAFSSGDTGCRRVRFPGGPAPQSSLYRSCSSRRQHHDPPILRRRDQGDLVCEVSTGPGGICSRRRSGAAGGGAFTICRAICCLHTRRLFAAAYG